MNTAKIKTQYFYESGSDVLIEQWSKLLENGDHFSVIGPQAGGKRTCLGLVAKSLDEKGYKVISTKLTSRFALKSEDEVLAAFKKQTEGSCFSHNKIDTIDKFFEEIKRVSSLQSERLCWLISGFDRLSDYYGRKLLSCLGDLASNENELKPGIMLTGSGIAWRLVNEKRTPWKCDKQFVLSGHKKKFFEEQFFKPMESAYGLKFTTREDAFSRLFKLTGGDPKLLRQAIMSLLGDLVQNNGVSETISEESIPNDLYDSFTIQIRGLDPFDHIMAGVKALSPADWGVLERVVAGQKPEVPASSARNYNPPSRLELIGLLRRVKHETNYCLEFGSEYLKRFGVVYYDSIRIGDLFGHQGKWDQAFKRYEKIKKADVKIRPISTVDEGEVRALISSLASHFREIAIQSSGDDSETIESKLVEKFELGVKQVLGFSDLTSWEYTKDEEWVCSGSKRDKQEVIAAWLDNHCDSGGTQAVRDNECVRLCLAFEDRFHGRIRAFVVSDNNPAANWMSDARATALKDLAKGFEGAWRHLVDQRNTERRVSEHDEMGEIIDKGLSQLRVDMTKLDSVFEKIAEALMQNRPINRVLWFLHQNNRWMQLASRVERPGAEKLPTEMPRIAINDAHFTEVFKSNSFCQVKLSSNGGGVIAKLGQILSGRVFGAQLQDAEQESFGMLLIECLPSGEESLIDLERDLRGYGAKIAGLMEQAQRLESYRLALDGLNDPAFIVNSTYKLKFANAAGKKFLVNDEKLGSVTNVNWATVEDFSVFGPRAKRLKKELKDTSAPERESWDTWSWGGFESREIWSLSAVPMKNWRGVHTGYVVRLRSRRELLATFSNLYRLGQADSVHDAINRFVSAADTITGNKAKKVRFYEKSGENTLASKFASGFLDEEKALNFEQGNIKIERDPSDKIQSRNPSWQTIDRASPILWRLSSATTGSGFTFKGLEYENREPDENTQALEKNQGCFWIDFPLITDDESPRSKCEILGKISLEYDEENLPSPENYLYLKWFSQVFSRWLANLDEGGRRLNELEEAERRSLATTSHNVATRIASIKNHVSPLRHRVMALLELSKKDSEFSGKLRKIADDIFSDRKVLASVCDSVHKTLDRMKDMLREVELNNSELIKIRDFFDKLALNQPGFFTDLDEIKFNDVVAGNFELLETAFHELIGNSRKFQNKKRSLSIIVRCSIDEENEKRLLRIDYTDNGVGVPTAEKARIFDRFFFNGQGLNSKSTGLGLTFTDQVISVHEGTIEECGIPGEGAHFVIFLPLEQINEQTNEN